jgi:hypothetical protein
MTLLAELIAYFSLTKASKKCKYIFTLISQLTYKGPSHRVANKPDPRLDRFDKSTYNRVPFQIFKLVSPHDKPSRRRTPAQSSELAGYGPADLNTKIARAAAEMDEETTRIRSRDDVRGWGILLLPLGSSTLTPHVLQPASWGRASRASISSRAALESKHSSIGPLPLFPPRLTRSHGRATSISNALASQQSPTSQTLEDSVAQYLEEGPHSQTPMGLEPATQPDPLPSRTPKQRGRLAGLFGLGTKKSLEIDKENDPNLGAQSTPTTPSRRGFLGSMLLSTSTNSMRSTNFALEPAPPLPVTPKDKTKEVPSSPRVQPGRFSLPSQPRRSSLPATCGEYHNTGCQCHGKPTFQEVERGWQMTDLSTPTAEKCAVLQRRKSDGKNGRGRSPGQSIRVPGPTPPTHPHPHPYFPCEMPRDRVRLEHGMFDFERPGSRPSTPGLDEGLVMARKEKKRKKTRSQSRGLVEEGQDIALAAGEVVGLVAAGAEVRRDRRRRSEDVSKVRSRHVEDDLELRRNMSNPSVARSDVYGARTTTMGHGLFSFEPPVSPTASQTVLPHIPSSYSRRHEREPAAVMSTVSIRSQGDQVLHPQQPSLSAYVSYPNESTNVDSAGKKGSVKLHGTFSSIQSSTAVPVLSAKFKPMSPQRGHQHNLSQSTAVSASWNQPTASERHRHVHSHSHSLSGSTVGGPGGVGGYPVHPMRSTPTGLGIMLREEKEVPSREERYHDLCENLRLGIGESRYKIFERGMLARG